MIQNKTKLGEAAKKIQEIPVVGELAVPFSTTPSAVAMQIINYSPFGVMKEIFKQVRRRKFNQREFSHATGRSLISVAVLALGNELYKKGMIALDRPVGEKEQKLWELEGKKANSVLLDGKWRSPIVLGPAGILLLIGGHFRQAYKDTGSFTSAIQKALWGSAKTFTEQTFMVGTNAMMNALNDPERYGEDYLAKLVSSAIPTLASDIARASDPLERQAVGFGQRLKARIPGFRQTLEPQIDVLGQEIKTIGNPLEVLIDPTRPSSVKSTPVIYELRRLTDIDFKVSPTLLGDKRGFKSLTQKQNTKLWKRAGEITNYKLGKLFETREYQELPDDEKEKEVEDFISKSKRNARAELTVELTQGLTEENLIKELSRLKKDKFLTREVFDKYEEIR